MSHSCKKHTCLMCTIYENNECYPKVPIFRFPHLSVMVTCSHIGTRARCARLEEGMMPSPASLLMGHSVFLDRKKCPREQSTVTRALAWFCCDSCSCVEILSASAMPPGRDVELLCRVGSLCLFPFYLA